MYLVMSFKLFNAWVSFQDYIKKILAKKLNIFVVMYLDNILIYIKNLSQIYVEAVYWIPEQF